MQVHKIDASTAMERDEWVHVLRQHAAHHSIHNAYDVSKRKIAEGDHSEVYSAKDFTTSKKKALKIVPKDVLDQVGVRANKDPAARSPEGWNVFSWA